MKTSLAVAAAALAGLCTLATPALAQRGPAGARGAAGRGPAAPVPPPDPAPRWPDGHVNLGSDAKHKGYWEVRPGLGGFRAADVPFQPWAKAVYDYRNATFTKDSPLVDCKAGPGPSFFNAPGFEIVEVPEQKSIFILDIAGPHSWRVIHMDGRPHPKNLRPTFLGDSTGSWDGDTLTIDSVGFNEKMWAAGSFPTTSQLHMTERISRPNLQTLSYQVTIDDPGAYTKPFTGGWTITQTTASKWIAGGEMFEYICEDAAR